MEQIDLFALIESCVQCFDWGRLPFFKVIPLGIVVVAAVEIQSRRGWPCRCLFASQEKIFQHTSLIEIFLLIY